jgi:RNAse (barnase) inhibitor barstar
MSKKVYEIDGNNFSTLEEFCDEFNRKMNLEITWNGNLDALNDILNGGFGTPDDGFVLAWKNSAQSRERLDYGETIRQIEKRLQSCHPSNAPYFKKKLDNAKRNEGPTVFDWLVEIISGEGHEDIELRLE